VDKGERRAALGLISSRAVARIRTEIGRWNELQRAVSSTRKTTGEGRMGWAWACWCTGDGYEKE
jgi:hypothetical protein